MVLQKLKNFFSKMFGRKNEPLIMKSDEIFDPVPKKLPKNMVDIVLQERRKPKKSKNNQRKIKETPTQWTQTPHQADIGKILLFLF